MSRQEGVRKRPPQATLNRTGVALDGLGPVAGLEGLVAFRPFAIDLLDALQNGGCAEEKGRQR